MPPFPLATVDVGVDWLTATFDATADHSRLEASLRRARRIEASEGNLVHQWGFSGYKGERVSGLEWGYRHDGAIVRLSGFSAARWWKRFGKLATNCSRIDLQTTVIYDEHWTKTMRRHWREARRWSMNGKQRARAKVVAGLNGPETIYSGQRVSDTFLRCYHRGSKRGCENEQGHVRYEVELKARRGSMTLAGLLSSDVTRNDVRGRVLEHFLDRGFSLAWPCSPLEHECSTRNPTDIERRLTWLRGQVRPTVEFMLESGHMPECLDALGLSALVQLDH